MFGGFVDAEAGDAELDTEAAGAFQSLVDALAALQRDGLVRGDDTLTMARFVWATVHGVAMLGIDGQLRQPGDDDAVRDARPTSTRCCVTRSSGCTPASIAAPLAARRGKTRVLVNL